MPKNYFLYKQQIPFEINVYCSKLEVKLKRNIRKNDYHDHSKIFSDEKDEINKKLLILEKGKDNCTISDFIDFLQHLNIILFILLFI